MTPLVEKMLNGDRVALARLITHVESRSEELASVMAVIQGHLGRAQIIGITGPPGAGKSTLVDRLITQYRQQGKKVGVVAVDPSSPFSGGALLGDRIRMMDHTEDTEVFIRSLGSRGAHGGLSRATRDVVRLFDAFGMDVVLVETVGVGQTELDVLEVAHTTVVVLTPESGDTIQTLKAGLLEAADIFVVNKADRDGAHKIYQELLSMIEMGNATQAATSGWKIPVFQIQAHQGIGVAELAEAIAKHDQIARVSLEHQQKIEKLKREEFLEILGERVVKRLLDLVQTKTSIKTLLQGLQEDRLGPYQAALELEKRLKISLTD